ncbi:hypothetical protein C0995_006860, partial [Termitomyces sp. Mi166
MPLPISFEHEEMENEANNEHKSVYSDEKVNAINEIDSITIDSEEYIEAEVYNNEYSTRDSESEFLLALMDYSASSKIFYTKNNTPKAFDAWKMT